MYLAWVQNVFDCCACKTKVLASDNRSLSDQTETDCILICIDHSDDNLSPHFVEPYANAFVLNCYLKQTKDLFGMHVVCILLF